MQEFFAGWRRKVGCVTLVIAVLLMCGWLRSFHNLTEWKSQAIGERCYIVASEHGNLVFGELLNARVNVLGPYTNASSNTPAINTERRISGVHFDKKREVKCCLFSVEKRTRFWWNGISPSVTMELRLLVIPYASIVWLVTILAAYFLIRNPLVCGAIGDDGNEDRHDKIRSAYCRVIRKLKAKKSLPESWNKTLKQLRKTGANVLEKLNDHANFDEVFLDHVAV